MAISRKEKEVPKNLPPARLYLDDLEMVIKVFQEAKESQSDKAENVPRLKFEIENQVCTELTDLPKISETTKDLAMEVHMPNFSAYLRISPKATYWDSFGLTRKEEWSLHSKLEPIFQGRERPLVALTGRIPAGIIGLGLGIIVTLIVFPFLVSYSIPNMYYPLPSARGLYVVGCVFVVLLASYETLASSHTVVVLRPYSESSAERDKSFRSKAWDVAKIVLAAIVGALIYKFWPKS
jgi:hypothetical protein